MTTTPAPFTLDCTATASSDVLMQEIRGEAVLLDLASEKYFGLDAVGTRAWTLMSAAGDLRTVHARLCEEFDAPPERIASDLLALMQSLSDAGLVRLA